MNPKVLFDNIYGIIVKLGFNFFCVIGESLINLLSFRASEAHSHEQEYKIFTHRTKKFNVVY